MLQFVVRVLEKICKEPSLYLGLISIFVNVDGTPKETIAYHHREPKETPLIV